MFKVNENCKLSAVGVEFIIPKGFYIDIENMEGVNENEIRLVPAEKDCYINFRAFDDEYDSTMNSLIDTFSDFVFESGSAMELYNDENNHEYNWIVRPTEFNCNDLKGTCTQYDTVKRQYYRIHFEKVNGIDEWVEIYLEVDKNITTLKDVLKRDAVKTFFDSLMSAKEQ